MTKPKLITVTLNPAVDTAYQLDKLKIGESTRTKNPLKSAGGKGLNATRVAKLLGEEIIATGFLGGSNGAFIRDQLQQVGVTGEFIQVQGETRQCLSFIDSEKNQTEILEEGPCISECEAKLFEEKVAELLTETVGVAEASGGQGAGCSAVLAVSGSLPKGFVSGLYRMILAEAKKSGIKVILDTSGQALIDCIEDGPYLIKPNLQELEQVLGYKCQNEDEIWAAMEKLQEKGIKVVIVSDGENGSLVLYEDKHYRVSTANIEATSAVGSGDSFIAGFAAGMVRGYSIEQTLVLASACGAANAMEERTGYINLDTVGALIEQITVDMVK